MQNHQADSPLYVWPDVWSADLHLFIKSMVIHDTECPYWDQVSLNNTNKQTTPHLQQDVDYNITIHKAMDQFSGATTRRNLSQSLLFQGNENAEWQK